MRFHFFILGAIICYNSLTATTITLSPVIDNTLYQSATGSLSNGAGEGLFAGRTNQSQNFIRRALLQFDIAGNIPAGAIITDAALTLTLTMAPSNPATTNVVLHVVTAAWGEGASNATGQEGPGVAAQTNDATWLHRFFSTSSWTTAGGDFKPDTSATTSVTNNGAYVWSSAQLTADVQSWLDAPAANFGWIALGNEATALTARRFASSEAVTISTRPQLLITYNVCQKQDVTLASGWNMISGYVIPDAPDMADVFQDVVSNILIVKNNAGQTYIPSLTINTIGNWDFKQGYKVKTITADTLTLGCTQSNATTPIALNIGWNIIAYLRSTPMDISTALNSLGSDILIVKNNAGQTYIPSLTINTIGNMLPGQGYQIKMSAPGGTLVYPP